MLERDPLNVVITGVGGQGSLLASQVLGEVLVAQGFVVTIGETLGLSQRGGSVVSQIRISHADEHSPNIGEGLGHLIVALEPVEGLRALARFGNPEIAMVTNTRPVHPTSVVSGEADYPAMEVIVEEAGALCRRLWLVDATERALQMGRPTYANMVMLGAVAGLGLLPLDREALAQVLARLLDDRLMAHNLRAFDIGGVEVREAETQGGGT